MCSAWVWAASAHQPFVRSWSEYSMSGSTASRSVRPARRRYLLRLGALRRISHALPMFWPAAFRRLHVARRQAPRTYDAPARQCDRLDQELFACSTSSSPRCPAQQVLPPLFISLLPHFDSRLSLCNAGHPLNLFQASMTAGLFSAAGPQRGLQNACSARHVSTVADHEQKRCRTRPGRHLIRGYTDARQMRAQLTAKR